MTDPRTEVREARHILALWTGLLLAPLAFLGNLEFAYLMVRPSCTRGSILPVQLVEMAFLLIALAGGGVAWQTWRAGGAGSPDDGGGPMAWSRFMAGLGVAGSALFVLVIIAQWIPTFTLHPCQ